MRDDGPTTAPPPLLVGVLGRIRATTDGRELDLGGPRQRALLAALAVERGRTVPTDALIDAVWDGDPPDAAERTFRTYVSRLRKALRGAGVDGADVVVTDSVGYRLAEDLAAVDADLFDRDVAAAREQLVAGQAALAASRLTAALDRWEGRALGPFADRAWAAPTSVRLEEQRLVAQELLVRALLDAERVPEAVGRVEQLAAAEPLRETVARLHAQALYRAGRDADGLRVAREFRERLVEEHGIDPSPRLGELETMILERDPRLDRSVGGRRLRGYVLHEPIAHSPLGTVHRAEQPSIGREVAITVLPPERADDPDVVRAFEARIQAVAGLEHAHLLPVYDYWREPGGAYVVTRFPTGGTLAQRLRTGPLAADAALRLGGQVGEALLAAHEVGVAHGALGPDAVVVDEHGDASVWGFPLGPAHAADDVASLAALVASAVGDQVEPTGPGVRTSVLPGVAATAVQRALDPADDGLTTMAGLVAAFAAARAGTDMPAAPVPAPVGPNPYRGLAAFREADAEVFFGRGALVEQLRARVARSRAVAVVGPSGSGKSSAVRAGLLPHLRAEGAYVTTMVPGSRPLAELEVALSRVAAVELHGVADEVAATPAGLDRVVRRLLPGSGGELVLVVDQFEELFTIAEPTERDLLCTALRATVDDPGSAVRLVATVRADFLARVLAHADAGPLVRDRSVMVTPLTDDELHEVVTGPAEVAGVAVEPALATAIVADAARFPASLPMVQFALTEVFEAAEDGTMTLAAYRRIGGIEGVLGQRAEEVFAGLGEAERAAAHQLFQRLVVPNADGPPTRRRALRTELAHVPDDVVEAFGRARLVRFDHDEETREPTVEVTHEALFRAWPRLVAWIEEDEDDLRLLGHLTVTAGEWDARGRTEADLYRGTRLDAALAFADGRRGELSDTERDFLDASRARRARDAEADRRSVRRLRVLTGGLAVGLVLALVAGTLAVLAQRQEAATATAAQADALAFAASATRTQDLELAALLAAEAYAIEPDAESQRALIDVLNTSPEVLQTLAPPPRGFCGAQPPGVDLLVTARFDETGNKVADVRDYDLTRVAVVPVGDGARCPTIDVGGRWIVTGDEATAVLRALDVEDGRVLGEVTGWRYPGLFGDVVVHPARPEALAVTTDDRILRLGLPELGVLAELGPRGGGVDRLLNATYGEVGDRIAAVVEADDGRRRVLVTDLEGVEIVLTAPVPGLFEAAVAEQAGVVLTTGEDGLARAVLLERPDVLVPLGLRGRANGPIAVRPDGDVAALATTAGIELVGLEDRVVLGDPITIDTTFGGPAWGPDGELHFNGPDGVVTIDVERSLGVGEVVVDARPSQFGLWPAGDGSGFLQLQAPEVHWVDGRTGAEVVIGPAPLPTTPVAVLPDGEWLAMDVSARTFQRWQRDELVVEGPLPAGLPDGLERIWALLRVDNGVAVTIVHEFAGEGPERRPVRRHLIAMDVETASSLSHQVFELSGSQAPPLMARALGPDRLYVAFEDAHGEIRSMDGEVLVSRDDVVGNGEFLGVAPGGGLVASSDIAGAVNVLDGDLAPVARLTGISSGAQWLGFVSDDLLVTRHGDGATLLWDLSTSQLVGRLFSSDGFAPYGLAVAEDGPAVLQSTASGVVRIPIDPSGWLDDVCALVSRPLAQPELDAVAPGRDLLDPCGLGMS